MKVSIIPRAIGWLDGKYYKGKPDHPDTLHRNGYLRSDIGYKGKIADKALTFADKLSHSEREAYLLIERYHTLGDRLKSSESASKGATVVDEEPPSNITQLRHWKAAQATAASQAEKQKQQENDFHNELDEIRAQLYGIYGELLSLIDQYEINYNKLLMRQERIHVSFTRGVRKRAQDDRYSPPVADPCGEFQQAYKRAKVLLVYLNSVLNIPVTANPVVEQKGA